MYPVIASHPQGFFLLPDCVSTGSQTYVNIATTPIDVTMSILALAEEQNGPARRASGFLIPVRQNYGRVGLGFDVIPWQDGSVTSGVSPAPSELASMPVGQVVRKGRRFTVDVEGTKHDVSAFVAPILDALRAEPRTDLVGAQVALPLDPGNYRIDFADVDRGRFAARLAQRPEPRALEDIPDLDAGGRLDLDGFETNKEYLALLAGQQRMVSMLEKPSLGSIVTGLNSAGVDFVLVGRRNSGLDGKPENAAASIVASMLDKDPIKGSGQYAHIVVPNAPDNPALQGALKRLGACRISHTGHESITRPGTLLDVGESEYSTYSGPLKITAVDVLNWAAISGSVEARTFREAVSLVTPAAFDAARASVSGLPAAERGAFTPAL